METIFLTTIPSLSVKKKLCTLRMILSLPSKKLANNLSTNTYWIVT